jgi:hypothetical protein
LENQVSNNISTEIKGLKREVEEARKLRGFYRSAAILWSIGAIVLWASFAIGGSSALLSAVLFSGAAIMFWSWAGSSSGKYNRAVEKLSQHSK